MNYAAYCIVFCMVMLSMVASGVWLVVTAHYGWAWIPWLCVFLLRFRPPDLKEAACLPQIAAICELDGCCQLRPPPQHSQTSTKEKS